MSAGQIVCGIYWCIIVCCTGILAVQPAKLRKNCWWVKCLLVGAVLLIVGLNIGNSFYFKFSGIEYLIASIYSFAVLIIFFHVRFWELIGVYFLMWINLEFVRRFSIFICCMKEETTFMEYITSVTIAWHLWDVVMMVFTAAIMIFICFLKKDTSLIKCRSQKEYIFILILAATEFTIQELLFSRKRSYLPVSTDYVTIIGLVLMVVFSTAILFYIVKCYRESRYEEKLLRTSYEIMRQQYRTLDELYTEKRSLIHNTANQYILIDNYLHTGKEDMAIKHIERMLRKVNTLHTTTYTGISVIDIMLNYKMNVARQHKIQIAYDFDVYFCPMEDNDICVCLGNLLDNAIEAVQNLPEDLRKIHIFMRTANNIFVMEIQNPYEGKRNVAGGKYRTTKVDKESHGIGLESVARIVAQYAGNLDIIDDGQNFCVEVNLWSRDNNQELKDNLVEMK